MSHTNHEKTGTGIRINGSTFGYPRGHHCRLDLAPRRTVTAPGPARRFIATAGAAVTVSDLAAGPGGSETPQAAYRGGMGRVILILLAALAVVMLVSLVISALHFLFWIAVVAVVILGALRLSQGMRRAR
jgi:hypothetical protein